MEGVVLRAVFRVEMGHQGHQVKFKPVVFLFVSFVKLRPLRSNGFRIFKIIFVRIRSRSGEGLGYF